MHVTVLSAETTWLGVVKQCRSCKNTSFACSVVVLAGKVGDGAARRLLEKLCKKVAAPRNSKTSNEDAACICLKGVAAELPATHGAALAQISVPILLQALSPQVQRLHPFAYLL